MRSLSFVRIVVHVMLNPGIKPDFHFIRLEFWIILANSWKVWANSEPRGFSLGFRFASRLPRSAEDYWEVHFIPLHLHKHNPE